MRFAALVLILLLGAGCTDDSPAEPGMDGTSALEAHGLKFERGVKQLRPNVWVALGYGLANSILIEGEDGLIVIDTMESLVAGREVANEFRRLSDKPLKAIVYTHNHADHVFGAQAFIDVLAAGAADVEIIAHRDTEALVYRVVNEYRPILTARSLRMFGTHLDNNEFENAGIGLRLDLDGDSVFGFVAPTVAIDERLDRDVAGVRIVFESAPGETDDHLLIWVPELALLAPGDNLYRAFPNLYTIRGTTYRSPKRWVASLDRMRELPVELLVPSHTEPVVGNNAITKVLTDYRDGISFVHDQAVRYINLGYTPDRLVDAVRLPPHLAQSPYLQELYGTVEWSVRSVMAGNLGWFDGNPATLQPLAARERAQKLIALAGGPAAVRDAASAALRDDDPQWALELTDLLLLEDASDVTALNTRIEALKSRGSASINPNARHYYFSSALELEKGVRFEPYITPTDEMLAAIPLAYVFGSLPSNLRAEDVLDVDQRVGFTFDDTPEEWTVWIRRGVAEVRPQRMPDLDLHVHGDSLMFRKVLAGTAGPARTALLDFDFPEGNTLEFLAFLARFKRDAAAPEPAPLAGRDD